MVSRDSGNSGLGGGWAPSWVDNIGTAVWITDPSGRLSFVNDDAERMLDCHAPDAYGRPCHEIVKGRDELDRPFCASLCAIRSRVRAGKPVEPTRMRLPHGKRSGRWVEILAIPCQRPGESGSYLVHCVIDGERLHRLEDYLTRVATRDAAHKIRSTPRLTRREKEILDLLAKDLTLHAIACELNLSYTTVRNHVQHILRKLRVHSVHEAVAVHLLKD
jgi:DNA-binding CsgD family transcriptional regulator